MHTKHSNTFFPGDRVKVIVGGAPVTEDFAVEIGADGYSDNAGAAVTLARKLLNKAA